MAIDNYLRTSLIFYDSVEKQDFRKIVLENINIPKTQIVERYRLPPFNITSTNLIGIPTVFKLYSKHTNLETADLLDAAYGGADLLSLEFDGTNYWLVYDGEAYLGSSMPMGKQYVKISDGFRTWESEIINITNCFVNAIDWYDKNIMNMIYNTAKRGFRRYGQYTAANTSPLLYYYNNKTYGLWMQRGGAGYSVESMVYAIYHKQCFISESYGVGPGRALGSDPHAFPAVIVADDGHIIIAHERLKNDDPSTGHPSIMEVKRSDNIEDETSWVNAIAHNANYYTTVGASLSYPKLYKLTNGNIILFARGNLVERVRLFISTDHGVSFDAGVDVVDIGGSYHAYNFQPTRGTTSQIDIVIRRYNEGTVLVDECYYLKSVDGGTIFTDVIGGGAKNVRVAGALNLANLQANDYRICQDLVNGVSAIAAVMVDVATPYIVISNGILATRPLSIYEFSGGAWNEHITGIDEPYSNVNLVYNSDILTFDIIKHSTIGSNFVARAFRANLSDLTHWEVLQNIFTRPTTETYSLNNGHYTFNNVETEYHALTRIIDTDLLYNDFYIQAEVDICGCCPGIFKPITIEYENPYDFVGILSQVGYKGRIHLCADIRKPDHKIIKEVKERDGELFVLKVITQKIYRFNILCTESLIDILTIIPSYETITVHFDNESEQVKEFNVAPPEWKYEGLGQLEISFIVETIIKTNCDEDYVLQEELILNGDFSAWTGVYPNRDPDNWTISEIPPGEISEVAPNESHADAAAAGTGACNIYSQAGENIWMNQDVLTIGEFHLIEVKITTIAGGILVIGMGNGGNATTLSTVGIHRFVKIADGVDGIFYIYTIAACDVTIDYVSIKLYS